MLANGLLQAILAAAHIRAAPAFAPGEIKGDLPLR